jgi:hypothetical protein
MALDTNKFSEIFKNSDSDTVSKAEKSIKEAATERKDAAVLEMLKQQDPDTYRMFLAKAEKMEALPHVKPGDLITADLINALIDRINALEGGGESALNLGPLALQAHTLIALAGEIKAGAGLWLDGERLLDKDDEVANLAVLDGTTLALRLALVGDGNQLEAALEKLGHGNTILLRKGDVMMAQVSSTQKDGDAGATLRRQQTLIGVIQTDNDLELSPYLDSIQFDHQPFSWGLYNTRLKRFVLGGASENARLRNELVQVHEAKTVGDIK